jgi:hypothetical protein
MPDYAKIFTYILTYTQNDEEQDEGSCEYERGGGLDLASKQGGGHRQGEGWTRRRRRRLLVGG